MCSSYFAIFYNFYKIQRLSDLLQIDEDDLNDFFVSKRNMNFFQSSFTVEYLINSQNKSKNHFQSSIDLSKFVCLFQFDSKIPEHEYIKGSYKMSLNKKLSVDEKKKLVSRCL